MQLLFSDSEVILLTTIGRRERGELSLVVGHYDVSPSSFCTLRWCEDDTELK